MPVVSRQEMWQHATAQLRWQLLHLSGYGRVLAHVRLDDEMATWHDAPVEVAERILSSYPPIFL